MLSRGEGVSAGLGRLQPGKNVSRLCLLGPLPDEHRSANKQQEVRRQSVPGSQ